MPPDVTGLDARTLARVAEASRSVPRAERDRLTRRLVVAGAAGDVRAVCAVLAPDVIVVSDGGAAAPAAVPVACGVDDAAWLVAALLGAPGTRLTAAEVNGRLAVVVRRGRDTIAVVAPEAGPAGIAALWVVRNPAKLRAWQLP